MDINGIDFLDKNYYDMISIGKSSIDIISYNRYAIVGSMEEFSLSLMDLSNDEKIERVVRYYLEYNDVMSINERYDEFGKNSILIKSKSGKILKFNECVSESLVKIIMDKYLRDRSEFLEKVVNDEYIDGIVINLSNRLTRYEVDSVHDEARFKLVMDSEYKLFDFEEEFLNKLISMLARGSEIEVISLNSDESVSIKVGDTKLTDNIYYRGLQKRVSFNDSNVYKDVVLRLVDNYNKRINEEKVNFGLQMSWRNLK